MRRIDLRNAILSTVAVLTAILITNPLVQVPFNDDWTYAFSVRQLLATGNMTYHCGESAAFLTQAYWGALFAKLFGFSFVTLRFSTLPFALGSVVLVYLLARLANLRPTPALFAALLFGFSPLFLPLASSFMSDVPAEFAVLLSIYAFALAARADATRRAIALLILAYATTILGGLSRQIVWMIPLTSGPYVAILRRRDRPILIASLIGIAANVIVAAISSRWFYAQPFAIAEIPFLTTMKLWTQVGPFALVLWLDLWLTTLLLILPAALPAAWAGFLQTCANIRSRRAVIAGILAVIIAITANYWPALFVEPWLGDIISRRGVLSGMELSGHRPIVQPLLLRELLATVVVIVAWMLLTDLADRLFQPHPLRRLANFFQPPDNRIAIPAMLLFAAGYLALVAYRAPRNFIYDRYALPLIPCFAIPLLLKAQSIRPTRKIPGVTLICGDITPQPPPQPSPGIPGEGEKAGGPQRRVAHKIPIRISWALLIAWSAYAVASTQDVHALQAARRTAMDRLLAAKIPDTAIADGSEFDNWTQLIYQGYRNDPDFDNPPLYNPALGPDPALRCSYRVEFDPSTDTTPTSFGTINYLSWLPPFRRRIYIDKFINPTWLDPVHPTPAPLEYEDYHFH